MRRSRLANLLLLFFSLLFCVILAELGLRFFAPHLVTGNVYVQYPETVGIQNLADYAGCYDAEGHSCYQINADGWRDDEHELQKPAGVEKRIAIIGDSYVEAIQVELEQTFFKVLERRFAKENRPVEVMAFGMSGFDAAQAHLTLIHHVAPYRPDLVVWAFLPGNDLADALRELRDLPWKPYYTLDARGDLVLDETYKEHVARRNLWWDLGYRWLRARSHLISFLHFQVYGNMILRSHAPQAQAAPPKEVKPAPPTARQPGHDDPQVQRGLSVYAPPQPGDPMDRAWTLTEKLTAAMNRASRKMGARFMVMVLTGGDGLHVTGPAEGLDPGYPDQRMTCLGQGEGFPTLSLLPDIRQAGEKGKHFHGFGKRMGGGHWNGYGHEQAGLALYRFITENRLLDLE